MARRSRSRRGRPRPRGGEALHARATELVGTPRPIEFLDKVVGIVRYRDGSVIDGLYAVGNDRASIMGGNYPGAGITHGPNMTFGFVTAHHIADQAGARA